MDATPHLAESPLVRVWLTHASQRIDINKLRAICANIEVVFDKSVFPDNVDQRVPFMERIAADMAKEFNPTRDGLVMGGDPAAMAICVRAVSMVHPTFRILKFDSHHGSYYTITLGGTQAIGEENGKSGEEGASPAG